MKATLGLKLTAGFLASGAITLVVGLLGWGGVTTMNRLQVEDNYTQGIAKTLLQREIDHLNWARKVGQFQQDETMVRLDVEKDPHKCGFGKWYYGTERRQAEQVMPELAPVLVKLEAPHKRLHDSAVELEKFLAEGKESRPRAIRYYKEVTTAVLAEVQQVFGCTVAYCSVENVSD